MGLKWTTSTNSYEIIDTDIRSKAIITLDGSLRSVGDACDRVFLDKDFFWKIERNIGQDIIGTITSIVDVGGISGFEHQPLNRKKFSMILADRATHGVGENTFHITETATVFLGTAGDTISDINAKYSGMEVLYELAEPIITTLDNELQHLLNNIPSYEGDTYVHTSGGTVRPYLYGRFLTSVGSQVSVLGQRVQSAEVKIEPPAIVATVRESVAYQGDLSGLDDKIDGVESRVQTAESKITPQAITQTVTESQTYKDDLKGIDDKITNPNLLPLGWVDKTSNTAETLYEETVHLEKGDYWLIVDYTTIVGNQGQLLANGTLVSALTGAIYSAKWTQATSGNVTFKIINLYGFEFHLNFVKLEQGDKYTGFMADDGDLKYQSEYISTVEQTASKIAWIVKSGTSASNMVLTDEMYSVIASNIELTADNIKLEGYTTINNAFSIVEDGNVELRGGNIEFIAEVDDKGVYQTGGYIKLPAYYDESYYSDTFITGSRYQITSMLGTPAGVGLYSPIAILEAHDTMGGYLWLSRRALVDTGQSIVGLSAEEGLVFHNQQDFGGATTTQSAYSNYGMTVRGLTGTEVFRAYSSGIAINGKTLYLDNGYVKYTP